MILAETKYGLDEPLKIADRVIDSIKNKDALKLKNILQETIQSISYRAFKASEKIPELLYSSWIYLILAMSGFNVSMEEEQILGRPDIVLKYNNEVFIFEVKIDKSPDLAIKQIKEKNYFKKFLSNSVYAVGISISSKSRNVSEVLIEKIV
jgi:ABC-type microcin C transport system permease subunit YejE